MTRSDNDLASNSYMCIPRGYASSHLRALSLCKPRFESFPRSNLGGLPRAMLDLLHDFVVLVWSILRH
jgi:hypothetical protein